VTRFLYPTGVTAVAELPTMSAQLIAQVTFVLGEAVWRFALADREGDQCLLGTFFSNGSSGHDSVFEQLSIVAGE
jgi:hypothetical protein